MKPLQRIGRASGLSLVELMVAVAIISIVVTAFILSFDKISKAIQYAKARSVASDLCQDKVDQIKQMSYYSVLPSSDTSSVTLTDGTTVQYDKDYYPKEQITQGGVLFTRYTLIQVAQESGGVIASLAWNTADTGMKLITVTTVWNQGADTRKVQTKTVLSNPGIVQTNASVSGKVTDDNGNNLQNVQVVASENLGATALTDSSGIYSIDLAPGFYNVTAQLRGYFSQTQSVNVAAGSNIVNFNFQLVQMTTGTVSTSVWYNDHLVISQIVGATSPVSGAPSQGRLPGEKPIIGSIAACLQDWLGFEGSDGNAWAIASCSCNDGGINPCNCGSYNATTPFNYEWVEVYNPTTWTWTMADAPGSANAVVSFKFATSSDKDNPPLPQNLPTNIQITYVSTQIAPGGFYLFANTTTVSAFNNAITADAYWDPIDADNSANFPYFQPNDNPHNPNIIPTVDSVPGHHEGAGGLQLYNIKNGTVYDQAGWQIASGGASWKQAPAPCVEGGFAIDNGGNGLRKGEQFVRKSSTSTTSSDMELTLAPAYDANINSTDWVSIYPMTIPPRNTQAKAATLVAGVPAVGAIASVSDGLSTPTTAYMVGSPGTDSVWARSDVPNVTTGNISTGTWVVSISSNFYSIDISNVRITAGATTWITNDFTSPLWPGSSYSVAIMTSTTNYGYITGQVTDSSGHAIGTDLKVTAGDSNTFATVIGNYTLKTAPGTYTIIANENNTNTNYVSLSSANVVVSAGQIHSGVNFTLLSGGKIRGWVTTDGVNGLPGMAVGAYQGGSLITQQTTGSDGWFNLINIPTSGSAYQVQPLLNSQQVSAPTSANATLSTGGTTVSVGTFTVTAAAAKITGTCTLSSIAINTGVLIVATTVTPLAAPPSLSTSTLSGIVYYTTLSKSDGTYSLTVSSGTGIHVYGFYNSSGTLHNQESSGSPVNASPGTTASGVNFSW